MGIMTTISVIIIAIIFITIIDFGAQGRSELYVSHPKVQTLSNRTPDAQPAIAMEGGAADRNHSGEGQGGTHTTGNHRGGGGSRPQPQWGGAGGNPHHREPQGGGGIPWGGGGRGGLAALHHIWTRGYFKANVTTL